MHRVRMLRHFGVTPYMVFDGDYLPSKAATEESRANNREARKRAAMDLLNAGKPSLAAQEFQKCIDVTPEMASLLIHHLKKMDIPCVVAPYEADAQLVYLERKGHISGIISDDSDLLVFGAKRLLTKLDQYGNCIEINRRDFCACREVSLTGWSDAEFRRMAILSGCDYLGSLPGVGLKTAYRMLRNAKTPERAVRMIQFQGKVVSENYLTHFYQAELTFLHQWVFCPEKKELVHLTELDGNRTAEEMPFIGAYVEPTFAQGVAAGDLNPMTKEAIIIPTTPSKRRHSQAAGVVPAQPPIKPINSYFKGHHRIPMGEMDPNCFSVDAQRLAQITAEGSVPRVFPLPRPYVEGIDPSGPETSSRQPSAAPTRRSPRLQRRRTEPMANMLSGMSSNPLAPADRPDPPRPPKKARLCDDDGPKDISPKQSKFFAAKPPVKKSPRKTKSEAFLLSDDSIEEALLSLPDLDSWKPAHKTTKSITVFDEASQDAYRKQTEDSSKNESGLTLPTTTMLALKSTQSLSQQSSSSSRQTLSRFSFSSSASSATPSTVASRRSVFTAASTPSTAPSSAGSRLTPLQRLGAQALNPMESPKKPRLRKSTGKAQLAAFPVNPAFVPLPKVDLQEVEDLHKQCGGSEDQIVPDSEGDDEGESDLAPKKLDLSSFAFA